MTATDELIARLSAQASPAPRPGRRAAAAMAAGIIVATLGLAAVFGRPLAAVADTGTMALGLKLSYALALAAIAGAATIASGRPGARIASRLRWIGVPLALVALLAAYELVATPPDARAAVLLGSTYWQCVASVALASAPVFAGLTWTFRLLAPTRLRTAGLLVGLTSGAAGAVAYALFCPEATASFLLAAYGPGMIIPAVIGWLAGPALLRW